MKKRKEILFQGEKIDGNLSEFITWEKNQQRGPGVSARGSSQFASKKRETSSSRRGVS